MLVITHSNLEIGDVVIQFGNGQGRSSGLRHSFGDGSRSRAIDLPGHVRFIRDAELGPRGRVARRTRARGDLGSIRAFWAIPVGAARARGGLKTERDIGFEPTTFSFGSEAKSVPSSAVRSQVVPIINNLSATPVHRTHPFANNTTPFVTRLLPGGRAGLGLHRGGAEYLLTVAVVAERLGVCTATVYKLCGRGGLVHVRILNTIRIAPAALAAYLAHAATSGYRPGRLG